MKIQLSDHFTYKTLFRFTVPTIVMMVFTSIYSVIDDGLFVSNFVGKTSFVAINLMAPVLSVVEAIGYMIGAGGSALAAKLLGEGNKEKASQTFSLLVALGAAVGVALTVLGYIALRPFCVALGAEGEILENCLLYGRVALPFSALFILQGIFQNFLITSEKPKLAMVITVVSGISNLFFDVLLIVVLKMGLMGAVLATVSGIVFGCLIPLIYFARGRNPLLHFVRPMFDWGVVAKVCTNGMSELVSNLSMGIVTVLYNFQLMRIAGDNGVAAYGVVGYVSFVFAAAFLGYSQGIAPVIGFNYGAKNNAELKNLFKKSITVLAAAGVALAFIAKFATLPLANIFVSYDKELLDMTVHGFGIYILAFLPMGVSLFGSALFTALNNGKVSFVISFSRTIIFQIGMVFLLPLLWGIDGVWWALVAAELLSLGVTVLCLVRKRKIYNYV